MGRLKEWWRTKVMAALVADDPDPEPSWLDQMDRRDEPVEDRDLDADDGSGEAQRALARG